MSLSKLLSLSERIGWNFRNDNLYFFIADNLVVYGSKVFKKTLYNGFIIFGSYTRLSCTLNKVKLVAVQINDPPGPTTVFLLS